MSLPDARSPDASHRIEGDAGVRRNRSRNVEETGSIRVGVRSSARQAASAAGEPGDFPEQEPPGIIPLESRAHLFTQAPSLTAQSAPASGVVNEVTPFTAALDSPSSPPIAAAASPTTLSVGSPSSRTSSHGNSSPTSKTVRKRGVPHIYRDFTAVPDMAGYVRKKTGGVTQPFPEKLHEMLDNVNEPNVVGWLPHGRAFIVRKPKEFTSRIMPKFFRQTKLTSFQRQLNLYGFRRLTQGADAGAYYHELFLRGRPQLCMRMQRQKVKGTGHKQPADAKTEPKFYAMAPSTYALSPSAAPGTPERMPHVDGSSPTDYEEMSPGMQRLHGAANLLKTIAAGVPASSAAAFSLGISALSAPILPVRGPPIISPSRADPLGIVSSSGLLSSWSLQGKPPAKSVPPSMDGSMSLLGRVNMEQPSSTSRNDKASLSLLSKSVPSQSAFFWPPIRRTQDPLTQEVAAPQGMISGRVPQQQESAQTSSSQVETGDEAADLNLSSEQGKSNDTSGELPPNQEKPQLGQAEQEEGIKILPLSTPFPAMTSISDTEGSGPMETKVTNGIETEEV